MSAWAIFLTALIEGACVIIVEIAGARALAPFFGTSLQVWTSQITATLLFLALGYGVGGLLAKNLGKWTLPALFMTAGFWLTLYPIMRTPLLNLASHLGVAFGSLLSAAMLFGVPLMMLGAVSPVLIANLHRLRPGAGSAAGRIFFTNTMGGLAGGWMVAILLIPHASLRVSLIATGVLLLIVAAAWALLSGSATAPIALALLAAGIAILILHRPSRIYAHQPGAAFRVSYSHQSGIGLLQVLDYRTFRQLLIDGVNQGSIDLSGGGYRGRDYIQDLNLLSYSYHADAKNALQLGLGAGLLPRVLSHRGVKVTAVDIEPQIIEIARKHFDLPADVDTRLSDARAFLRRDTATYDLIFLDTFASESTPWHTLTTEAMADMKRRLNPGGRLLINTVAHVDPKLPGLDGIESAVVSVFPGAMVHFQAHMTNDPRELINVTIVAGDNLSAQMRLPRGEKLMVPLAQLIRDSRPATARCPTPTDERNRLDYEQAPLRIHWRKQIWAALDANLLWD